MGVKIRERNGAWWVYVDHKRQRKAKRVGTGAAGKPAAETVAKQYDVELALGQFDFSRTSGLTLQAYVGEWLASHGLTLKLGTREKYAEIFRVHWFPALGEHRLADITRAQVKAVVAEKARTYARSTVVCMVDVLCSCLHAATEDGIIAANPAARLGALAAKARKPKPVEAFTADTLATILETAKQKDPALYPLVLLLARTGLRIGEALALQVRDIQLDTRTIQVCRTWGSRLKANGPARFNVPKGGTTRTVDMSKQLTAVMTDHVRADPEAWLFPGHAGDPMEPWAFLRPWRRLLALASVRYRKPHTLRHTYASLLIQSGESLAYVRDQLGHSSIKITVDTYGHLIPGMNHAAVDRLDALGTATLTQPVVGEGEVRNHQRRPKCLTTQWLSTPPTAEAPATPRKSIFRTKGSTLSSAMSLRTPRRCRSWLGPIRAGALRPL